MPEPSATIASRAVETQTTAAAAAAGPARVASVDAFRGLVMLLMMAEVLELAKVSAAIPHSAFWRFLARHQTHVDWVGCSLHDLIQPSFSFLVGVALPFSLAKRQAQGQPRWRQTLHAFWRAAVLVFLGIFLRSLAFDHTRWTFEDTLTQIGLGYGFLYLLGLCSVRIQWAALGVILLGYWLAFALYPLPGANFDWHSAGVQANWPSNLTGFAAHWNKNTNLAWAFDRWWLNLFPPPHWFQFNPGGYATLSFIPTLGTMILGLIAGGVLRGDRSPWRKVLWFLVAGMVGLAAGWLLGTLGVCPVVKRIWTPSWTIFSGGWCFLLLAGFYVVLDIGRFRAWALPLIVVGVNSIAAYLMDHLFRGFIDNALRRHLGRAWYTFAGTAYEPLLLGAAVLFVEWLILWWMYRRKILLKI